MAKKIANIIAWIYGVIGGILLLIGLFTLYVNYSDLGRSGDFHGFVVAAILFYTITAIIFILISFAFHKLKRWGRYLAIGYNLFLMAFLLWISKSLWQNFSNNPTANALLVFFVVVVIVMGAITGFCFTKSSKDLLCN